MPDEMVEAYAKQMDATQKRSFPLACLAALCVKSYYVFT